MKVTILVAFNEHGHRIGETHHNATIPDATINAIRDAHEDEGLGYRRLAARFGISKNVIAKICRYERRGQVPREWRRVATEAEGQASGNNHARAPGQG